MLLPTPAVYACTRALVRDVKEPGTGQSITSTPRAQSTPAIPPAHDESLPGLDRFPCPCLPRKTVIESGCHTPNSSQFNLAGLPGWFRTAGPVRFSKNSGRSSRKVDHGITSALRFEHPTSGLDCCWEIHLRHSHELRRPYCKRACLVKHNWRVAWAGQYH